MNTYEVEVDVSTVYRVEIDAPNEDKAREYAKDMAYQDTWDCTATFGGAEIYSIEKVGEVKDVEWEIYP